MIHSPALSTFLLTLSAPCVGNTITIILPTSLSWWPTKTIYISHFGAGAPAYGKSTIRLFLIVGKLDAVAVANLRPADRRLAAMQPKTPPAPPISVMKSRRSLPAFAAPKRSTISMMSTEAPWTCVGVAAPRPWTARWRHLPRPELTPPLATIRAAFGVGR